MRFQKIILHKKNRSGSRKSDESERFFAFCAEFKGEIWAVFAEFRFGFCSKFFGAKFKGEFMFVAEFKRKKARLKPPHIA